MPIIRCPQCKMTTPRRVDDMGDNPEINYFCCRGCGRLWTTRSGNAKAAHVVQPLAKLRKASRASAVKQKR